jgi:hypothetical protein
VARYVAQLPYVILETIILSSMVNYIANVQVAQNHFFGE